MLLFKKIIIFTFIIILSSCGGGKEKVSIIEEEDIDLQMVDAFRKGYEALQDGDVLFAAKKLYCFSRLKISFLRLSNSPSVIKELFLS